MSALNKFMAALLLAVGVAIANPPGEKQEPSAVNQLGRTVHPMFGRPYDPLLGDDDVPRDRLGWLRDRVEQCRNRAGEASANAEKHRQKAERWRQRADTARREGRNQDAARYESNYKLETDAAGRDELAAERNSAGADRMEQEANRLEQTKAEAIASDPVIKAIQEALDILESENAINSADAGRSGNTPQPVSPGGSR